MFTRVLKIRTQVLSSPTCPDIRRREQSPHTFVGSGAGPSLSGLYQVSSVLCKGFSHWWETWGGGCQCTHCAHSGHVARPGDATRVRLRYVHCGPRTGEVPSTLDPKLNVAAAQTIPGDVQTAGRSQGSTEGPKPSGGRSPRVFSQERKKGEACGCRWEQETADLSVYKRPDHNIQSIQSLHALMKTQKVKHHEGGTKVCQEDKHTGGSCSGGTCADTSMNA